MIRREKHDAWLLISQIEHARISSELFAALDKQRELADCVEQAILVHDDGWQEFDASLSFDDGAGRPLDFREMSRADQDKIWGQSVEAAVDLGLLAQAIIASHFIGLRGKSPDSPRKRSGRTSRQLRDFVAIYQPKVDAWMAQLDAEEFESALAALKWFDNLSLWLCCADRSELWSAIDHRGEPVVFEPISGVPCETAPIGDTAAGDTLETDAIAANVESHFFRVDPWPFERGVVMVEAPAKRLLKTTYETPESMRSAVEDGYWLRWHLRPN